jgi:hypothetical protein
MRAGCSTGRHPADTCEVHAGGMTASLFVTGTRVGSIGFASRDAARTPGRQEDVAHAVAKPVVDGLEASVCGQLVRAAAGEDWPSAGHAERCEECARIAG